MKDKENIYTEWKTSRSRIDLPDKFSDRVMAQIARQDQERSEPSGIPPFLEKAIDILVGLGLSVLGAFRVAHLVGGLLLP
ncbi:uncharacterized protein Dvar_28450 [Desulfosarcina variabilis str. Montpellier]|uniref:hypothetical protein n=1 Tax=Desulfosarcina variabilis TaxID=2300 RepID=UPI003AFA4AFD